MKINYLKQPQDIFIGHPIFADTGLAQQAREEGVRTAWRRAIGDAGEKVFERVNGDFAVAVVREDGSTVLAVDRFSMRTLCYRQVGDQLFFAERADDLADANTEIDPQAIYNYLYFHVIPSPGTIYKGIYRLPPGCYAVFAHGQLKVTRYWLPEFSEPRDASFSELRDEFRALLHNAVAAQLNGSKPACFLSGGTDSSTVAGMIGAASGRQAATYSIGFEAEGYDEMEYARLAARHFSTDHHEYYVTPDDLTQSIPEVARYYDQPFGNSSALPAYYCAKMASDDGVTKILAGDGGDELFGGNSRYGKQKLFDYYAKVPTPLRSLILEPLLMGTPLGRLPFLSKGQSYIEQARTPMPERTQMYNMLTRLGIEQVLDADFLAGVDWQIPLAQQRDVWVATKADSPTNRELAFDWRYTLAECDLPKVVGTTKLAGIDVGFPMLSQQLVNFSMRLPVAYKLKGQKLRWFFKESLRGFLPDEILIKKKQGFGLPFGVWVVHHSGLRRLAEDSVRGLVDRKIFRSRFVDDLFKNLLHEHPGYYGEMIWIAMMLEQWLRQNDHCLDTRYQ